MTKADFIKMIDNGSDILFDVLGHHLCIFTWVDGGIGIGMQHDPAPLTVYKTATALVENYKVDGLRLEVVVNDITITDYT